MAGGTLVGGQKESSYRWAKTCFTLAPNGIIFGSGVVSPEFTTAVLGQPAEIQKQWAEIIKKCDYIGVRGPLSCGILEGWGIHNVEIIGDPVLSISQSKMPDARSIENNLIGFNVGQAEGSVWGSEAAYMRRIHKIGTNCRQSRLSYQVVCCLAKRFARD